MNFDPNEAIVSNKIVNNIIILTVIIITYNDPNGRVSCNFYYTNVNLIVIICMEKT